MADYKEEYIGVFLNEVSNKLGQIEGKNILNDSAYKKIGDTFGTLTNKRELSEFLIEKEIDWEIFRESNEINDLTENIYNFIVSSRA